jgi:outer membrane protein assembly factor BamD
MIRRFLSLLLPLALALTVASCRRGRVQNPIADLDSKQPDKVLFDRAMEAMKRGKFDVARLTLQTMINTYPDSEYVARAKLAVGDSWYAEGGSAGLAQAEIEYKDFITFFPNMPEASEAQLKVANIHYRQMEKPDRDFTHAKRAEEEYKQLLLQFPDTKLAAEAKQRLLEVQEVLAEREFRIGRFYFLRESWPAAIARLKSVTDAYPLYSAADEALFMLGTAYEKQIERVREVKLAEVKKSRLIEDFSKSAAEAYSRILTRYPVMPRAEDAKQRLEALRRPVPTATAEAIAQNKAEEESRRESGRFGKLMANFRRKPDVSQAAKVGEPTLVTPKQTSATEITQRATAAIMEAQEASSESGSHSVTVEKVGSGAPPTSEPTPRSDSAGGDKQQISEGGTQPAAAPPSQVNEAAGQPGSEAKSEEQSASASKDEKSDSDKDKEEDNSSSSKKKKKKGLRKLVPF